MVHYNPFQFSWGFRLQFILKILISRLLTYHILDIKSRFQIIRLPLSWILVTYLPKLLSLAFNIIRHEVSIMILLICFSPNLRRLFNLMEFSFLNVSWSVNVETLLEEVLITPSFLSSSSWGDKALIHRLGWRNNILGLILFVWSLEEFSRHQDGCILISWLQFMILRTSYSWWIIKVGKKVSPYWAISHAHSIPKVMNRRRYHWICIGSHVFCSIWREISFAEELALVINLSILA